MTVRALREMPEYQQGWGARMNGGDRALPMTPAGILMRRRQRSAWFAGFDDAGTAEAAAIECLARTIEEANYPGAYQDTAAIRSGVQNRLLTNHVAVRAMLAFAMTATLPTPKRKAA